MWSRQSWWLYGYLKLRGEQLPLNLLIGLGIFVPYQLLLAWEGLLRLLICLLPKAWGGWLQNCWQALLHLLGELLATPPLTIADIDITDGSRRIRALLRTGGGFCFIPARGQRNLAFLSAQDNPPFPLLQLVIARYGTITLALALAALIFPDTATWQGVLIGALLLTLLYLLLRPLLLTLLLPLNMLLAGLLTPLADGLLLILAAAWVGPLRLSYWQGVAVALGISAAYWLYIRIRQPS